MDNKKRGYKFLKLATKKGKKIVSKEDIKKFKSQDTSSLETPKQQKTGPPSKKKLSYEMAETLFESQDMFANSDESLPSPDEPTNLEFRI